MSRNNKEKVPPRKKHQNIKRSSRFKVIRNPADEENQETIIPAMAEAISNVINDTQPKKKSKLAPPNAEKFIKEMDEFAADLVSEALKVEDKQNQIHTDSPVKLDGSNFYIFAFVSNNDGTLDFNSDMPTAYETIEEAIEDSEYQLREYGGTGYVFEVKAIKKLDVPELITTDIIPKKEETGTSVKSFSGFTPELIPEVGDNTFNKNMDITGKIVVAENSVSIKWKGIRRHLKFRSVKGFKEKFDWNDTTNQWERKNV